MPATVTVTATVQDPSGTALSGNCFLRFRLRNFTGFVPQISGTSIMPEILVDAVPTNGLISQALWPNNAITPSTTFYTVELWNQGRITSSGNYIFNANTSLNSASQVNAPPVPAGFTLVLENNSVLNSSQSTLNLSSTDASVVITDLGAGQINLQASSVSFATAGKGWISPAEFMPFTPTTISGVVPTIAAGAGSANQVGAVQFILPYSVTIRAVAMGVVTGGGTGFATTAIYDSSGTTKLLDAGANAFDTHTASQVTRVVSIAPVTLPAGIYWWATGSTDVAGAAVGYTMYQYLPLVVNANSVVRYGTAANSLSAGAMPSTLGTITGLGTSNSSTVPHILFLT